MLIFAFNERLPRRITRFVPVLLVWGCIATVAPQPQASGASNGTSIGIAPARAQRKISLRDRLIVGLQARLESEIEFVETVALRVQTGQLPQRLVDETFFWARARAKQPRLGRPPRRPIILFQPALRLRAERLDIEL